MMIIAFRRTIAVVIAVFGISSLVIAGEHGKTKGGVMVNVYSYRQPFLIRPLMDAFTRKTGIKVNIVFAKKGMLERLQAEGENTSADVVLTVDISRLSALKNAGLLQSVQSDVLHKNIPAHLRDEDNQWFALTTRARLVVAHKDKVKEGEIANYEDLTGDKWKGRICTRSGKHPYNVALWSSIIAHKGNAEAEKFLSGLKANLARKPQGNDRAQVKAIFEGVCDVAIINSYYLGKMATNDKKPEQKKWYSALRVIFPNQGNRGTHVNISGAGVVKHSKNRDNAVKLLEYLASDEAQKMYAEVNHEYPIKAGVKWSDLVASWGSFKMDTLPLSKVAANARKATQLVDKVGYDH